MKLRAKFLLYLAAIGMATTVIAGCGGTTTSTPTATNKPTGTLTFGQAVPITSLSPQGFQPEGYPSGYEAAFAIFIMVWFASTDILASPQVWPQAGEFPPTA